MVGKSDPLKVNCGVCGDICKRGVKVICCNAKACRNCAVKHITKNKACWKSDCNKTVSTDIVVNDEELRALVDSLEDSEAINCTVCGEICKRGVVLTCCKAPCCRSCGVKKVTADRACWVEDCGALGLKSDDLENDDLLRSAVDHYKNNGAMDPVHLNSLKQRREKSNGSMDSSSDQNGHDSGRDSDNENEEQDSREEERREMAKKAMNNKRKSPDEKSAGVKKAKFTGMKSDIVFLEMDMVHSYNKVPQILQLGLSAAPEKGKTQPRVFMQAVSNPVVENIKVSSTLNSLNLSRAGDRLVLRVTGKKMECKTEKESLQGALNFLQAAKSSYVGPPVTLVTYRNVTIAHFVTALKRQGLQGRFQNIVGNIISLEEIFEEKDVWTLLPLKSLNKVFASVMGIHSKWFPKSTPSCDEIAKNLRSVVLKMAEKHDFDVLDLSKPVRDVLEKFTNLDVALPMEPNTYVTENSCNFDTAQTVDVEEEDDDEIEEIQEIQVVKKTISTPKMKLDKVITAQGKVEVAFRSLSFPVFNQPVLVELKNAKKSVNFVNLQVSPAVKSTGERNNWSLPKVGSLQVHWMQGKAYVLAPILPRWELSMKNNSHEVKPFEDFKAKSVFGDYQACEGVPLVLQKPVKLVVSKTGKNERVSIGPNPTVIMVKIANLPPKVELTPCHAFVLANLELQGVTVVSKLFGVNANNASQARARIVVQTNGVPKVLKNGQVLGTAFLVSERNISRAFEAAKSSQDIFETIQENKASEAKAVPAKPRISPVKMSNSLANTKKLCSTVGLNRLYGRGNNPVLVKLAANSSDAKKFNSASIQFTTKFREMVQATTKKQGKSEKINWKEKESSKKCRVLWKEESAGGKGGAKTSVPYAFVDISIVSAFPDPRGPPRYLDLPKAFELVTYTPAQSNDDPFVDLSMSICVDFTERNVFVNNEPKSIEVYLKFKDTEIEKEKVKDQVFFIEGCYNDRVEILTKVFKTKPGNRLAPQKTSTNDMKATLIMRARYPEDVVRLAGREVIAIAKAASPSVNLVKLCAVSGDGAMEEEVAPPPEHEEAFNDPEVMMSKEGGVQRNQRRMLREDEFDELDGMRSQRGRREDLSDMRGRSMCEDMDDMIGRRGGMREEEMYGMGGRGRQQWGGKREEDLDDMEMMYMRMKRFDGPSNRGGRREEDLDDMEMMRMRMKRFDGPSTMGGRREEDLDDMEMMRMRMKHYDEGPSGMGGHDDDFNDMEMMRMRMKSLDEGFSGMSGYRGRGGMDEEMYRESQRYEDDMDGGFQAKGFQSRFGGNFGGGIDLREASVFEKARQKLGIKNDPWM